MYVENKVIDEMGNVLKIVGDPTRIKILLCFMDELDKEGPFVEKCVNDISNQLGISQSLTSHQLKVLKDSDLVKTRKEATKIYYSLKDEHVQQIIKITFEHVTEREL